MAGVDALPAPEHHATTPLVEALHFRRGFHYIAVREMEMEIPIPSLPSLYCVTQTMMTGNYVNIFRWRP